MYSCCYCYCCSSPAAVAPPPCRCCSPAMPLLPRPAAIAPQAPAAAPPPPLLLPQPHRCCPPPPMLPPPPRCCCSLASPFLLLSKILFVQIVKNIRHQNNGQNNCRGPGGGGWEEISGQVTHAIVNSNGSGQMFSVTRSGWADHSTSRSGPRKVTRSDHKTFIPICLVLSSEYHGPDNK